MWKTCLLPVVGLLFLGIVPSAKPPIGQSQVAQKISQADNTQNGQSAISLETYQSILEKERKLLEEESERYYSRVDKLIERATWFFGVAAAIVTGLLSWTFLKSRKEVLDTVKAKLEEAGITRLQKQLKSVRDEYQSL